MADEADDGEKEALHEEIKDLSEKVADLEAALRAATRPLKDVMAQLEGMNHIAGNYFRLLELYNRKGSISPEAVLPELKDPIAIEIVKVLFEDSNLNVTEITDRLRDRRGSASRTIVRERLQTMVEDGIVVTQDGPNGVTQYCISEDVSDRWFRLLGLRR
ncbi:MAG: transcriptional regulator [Thermoplasmata archaeon]|nr:transcriptional regulator [Thermoplasmata archaeon]